MLAMSEFQQNVPAAGLEASVAQWDIHVHLPAGAVQKDGPSAGITLAAALASLFAERCARADTAMTGELTLRGLVLPVGGIKEKLLAAHQAGTRSCIWSLLCKALSGLHACLGLYCLWLDFISKLAAAHHTLSEILTPSGMP